MTSRLIQAIPSALKSCFVELDGNGAVRRTLGEAPADIESFLAEAKSHQPPSRWIFQKNGRHYRLALTPLKEGACLEIREDLQDLFRREYHDLEHFAAIVPHHLKEPLRTITAYLGLIKQKLPPEVNGNFDRVAEACSSMRELVDRILAYYRIGKPRPVETVECEALMPGFGLPTIRCASADAKLLFDLLRQLGANRMASRREGEEWIFSAEGIDVSPEELEHLFDAFSQNEAKRRFALLSIKKLVEKYGGTIWLETNPPRFCFSYTASENSLN